MNEQKAQKKNVVIAAILLALIFLAAALTVTGLTGCSNSPSEIAGKWAVVYRCVDNDGNKIYSFTQDEYVEITNNKFTVYKGNGDDCIVQLDTKISYHENTRQENSKLFQLCHYSSYRFSLAEFSGADFGFRFYGSDCMAIGAYSSSTAMYAVLVRCSEIGVPYEVNPDIDGVWASSESATKTIEISGNSFNQKEYTKSTENGLIIFYGETADTTYDSAIAVLYCSSEYIAVLTQTEIILKNSTPWTEVKITVYLKGA